MGKVGLALLLAVAIAVQGATRGTAVPARAQSPPPAACNGGQIAATPMQGHYTGAWHSDAVYQFNAFNTIVNLDVTINGTLDAHVEPDGSVSGTAVGQVDAPIIHDGQR